MQRGREVSHHLSKRRISREVIGFFRIIDQIKQFWVEAYLGVQLPPPFAQHVPSSYRADRVILAEDNAFKIRFIAGNLR